MMCCTNCFGDKGLKKEIARRSKERGPCKYCKSEDQDLVKRVNLRTILKF